MQILRITTFLLVGLAGISSAVAQSPAIPSYTIPSGANLLPPPPDYAPSRPSEYRGEVIQMPIEGPGSSVPMPSEGKPSIMAQSIAAPVDSLPLQSVQTQWYSRPWVWFPLEGWASSIEFGLNGTEGNSQSVNYLVAAKLKRQTDNETLAFDINHRRATSNSLESQNNAFFGTDYDMKLGETPWSIFLKQGLEYDEFKAFDSRLYVNSGLGYFWFRTPLSNLVTRFGAGSSREFGGPDNEWKPEAVFGVEADHQINARNKVYGKIEYYPEWTDFSNYRMVSDVGWEVLVSEENNLSFKVAATNRYDSTPNGRKPSDLNYSMVLLYKF
jgi:putative salt-induced outer membrane protein YdiY